MIWQAAPYVVTLSVAALISMMLAVVAASTNRSAPGSRWAALLMAGVCVWSVGAAMGWASREPAGQLLWARVGYIGVVIVPATWLAFALAYTGRPDYLQRTRPAWLVIEPLAVLSLVWTNDRHHLFWSEVRLSSRIGDTTLQFVHGPAFWVHTLYSYVLLAFGTLLIIRALAQSSHLYRGQAGALLVGVLAPWLANIVYIARLSPWPDLDPTPLAFTVTGLALTWAMLRFRLWRLSPVARAAVVEGMSDGVFVFDGQGYLVDLNPAGQRILGRPAAAVIGQTAGQVLADHADLVERLSGMTDAHWEIVAGESDARGWYDLRVSSLHDRSSQLSGQLIVLRNISELKRTEEQLIASEEALREHQTHLEDLVAERTAELEHVNEALAASLREKEVLLQEIHHRVKNNLQVISSLLSLQTDCVADPHAHEILRESQHRVRSMALIHEKLYRSPDLAQVDFGDYVHDLTAFLFRVFKSSSRGITLRVEAEPIGLPVDIATPCGLILNELVSNALKHAFPNERSGTVSVALQAADGRVNLVVADTGIGLAPELDFRRTDTLGLQLVNMLVEQLDGTVDVCSQDGTQVAIGFTLPARTQDRG